MLSRNSKSILLSFVVASTLLVGCGSSTTDAVETTASQALQGQLVDSYVKGATYSCADGKVGITALNGEFACDNLPVRFQLGGLQLGEIAVMPQDKHIFPQDLVGVDRKDTNDSKVVAIAQLLQSLDSDANPENGIDLNISMVNSIVSKEDFNTESLDIYLSQAGGTKVDVGEAQKHLERTRKSVEAIESVGLPADVAESLNSVQYTLSEEVKSALEYMGNEERLAYDIYNKLATLYPSQKPLHNIPTKSEIKHFDAVMALVTKYDINTTVLAAGVYDNQEIQDLYDLLLEKGVKSELDALQVGCMVEVRDIEDLDRDIAFAEASNALDVVTTFNFLRDGSYSHYWAFDKAIKGMGVSGGCCSLGEKYCKTEAEYPLSQKTSKGI